MTAVTFETIDNFTQDDIFCYLIKLDDEYFNNVSLIPDFEYDAIRKYAKDTWPTSSYFTQTGSKVRGAEVKHVKPVGGLHQLYDGEVNAWVQKKVSKKYVVSEKLDGASATLSYVGDKLKIALSKGDGLFGKDFTRHVLQIPSVPKVLKLSTSVLDVRGEIIIKKEHEQVVKDLLLKLTGKEYKNLRNIVNGLLNASDVPSEVLYYFDFVAYGIIDFSGSQVEVLKYLKQNDFLVPQNIVIDTISEEWLTELLHEQRDDSEYEIDGLVIDIDDLELREGVASDLTPNYAFKWKVSASENHAFSTCVGVEWNISKHNLFKPTVLIEPVDLVGVTISRLSGFNARFIQENGIGPGAIIEFTRSGDVIPHILGVTNKVEPVFPEGWKWNENKVEAVALEESEQVNILRIKSFFNSLEIDQLQEASINTLVANGFDTIEKIIYMDDLDWNQIIGANGLKSYVCILKKFSNLHMYELMGAWPYFGFGFGVTRAKTLCEALDNVFTATKEEILEVEGFADKMADIFLAGRDSFIEFHDEMLRNDIIEFAEPEEQLIGCLNDHLFVFTGFRNKIFEDKIKSLGGEVQDGIRKDTTHLVVKDASKRTSKLEKAEKQGIKILDIEQLEKLLGE